MEGMGESRGPTSCQPTTLKQTPNMQKEVVEKLQKQIEELERRVEAREHSPEPELRMVAPFSPSIMDAPLPRDFRLPTIKAYTGTSDLRVHMTRYKATMVMTGAGNAIMCRAFLTTLDGTAQDWFNTIPDGSIQNFAELSKHFLTYFSRHIQHKKPFSHLYGVKQDMGESLRNFLSKWKTEVNNVCNFDSKVAILMFIHALRSGNFHRQLNTHHLRSYEELMRIANRYAEAEETDRKKKDEEEGRKSGRPDKVGPTNHAPHPNQLSTTKGKVQERPRLAPPRHLTPLTHPVSVILSHAEEMRMVHFPSECMAVSTCEDQTKYCWFHQQVGHDTDECHTLKGQVEELVQSGYFTQFVKYSGHASFLF
ncbi:uncharacterized protein LOC116033443 [Ipomoea triloba]|uniref:uncharacterized protein LOC116033443 n=1 Tax=Ipomoea triloba TaxID=35885 RepID=UPI00125D9E8E|nr:uncharacterized protein LOC116033443 [Ipomoea triloba]